MILGSKRDWENVLYFRLSPNSSDARKDIDITTASAFLIVHFKIRTKHMNMVDQDRIKSDGRQVIGDDGGL